MEAPSTTPHPQRKRFVSDVKAGKFDDLRVDDLPRKMLKKESFKAYQVVNLDISLWEVFEAQKDALLISDEAIDKKDVLQKVSKFYRLTVT